MRAPGAYVRPLRAPACVRAPPACASVRICAPCVRLSACGACGARLRACVCLPTRLTAYALHSALPHLQTVGQKAAQLQWPVVPAAPPDFRALAVACMAANPDERPTMGAVLEKVQALMEREEGGGLVDDVQEL